MKFIKLTVIVLLLLSTVTSYSLEIEYDDYVAEINEAFDISDYEAALYLSKSALAEFPDEIELMEFKAEALFQLKNYTEAYAEWEKVILKKPESKDAYFKAMYSLREINKSEKSGSKKAENIEKIYEYYEKYHELDEYSDYKNIYDLGNMYVKDNLYEKAYTIFSKDKNEYFKNLFGAALTARFLGEYDTSINMYEKLIKEYPQIEEAYFGLAVSYRLAGDFTNSIKYFRKHLEYKQSEQTYIAIAEMEMVMGKYGSAKTILEIGKDEFPKSRRMEELLIEIYSNSKN